MPSLTMANGQNPVSGVSFKKVADSNPPITSKCDKDNEPIDMQRGMAINGHNPSDETAGGNPSVEGLRLRLKKGRITANRNGCVYEQRPGIPFYNNNGPLKAFPMSHDNALNSGGDCLSQNINNSSLPNSESDFSSATSSSNESSPSEQMRLSNIRLPLQRLNGRGPVKQNLPPGLADPSVGTQSTSNVSDKMPGFLRRSFGAIDAAHNNNRPRSLTPPLKSAMTKHDADKRNGNVKSMKEGVTFAEYQLPPGMSNILEESFVPGVKACFQHETDLPLLFHTDASILRRRSSISVSKRNRVNTPPSPAKTPASRVAEDATAISRSKGNGSDVFIHPDMELIKICWNIVLCFMGDDKHALAAKHNNRSIGSIVSKKRKKIWRKSSGTLGLGLTKPVVMEANAPGKRNARPKSMIAPEEPDITDHSKKVPKRQPGPSPAPKYDASSIATLTVLEKVQFLVNSGFTVPFLQDEIFCLVMKQLVNNPLPQSMALGWILLSLIAGCFAPSERILDHVMTFIDHHQHAYGIYCAERLRRTLLNGPRGNPPCSLEIQAARTTEPILFPVICMDSSILNVSIDSATTCKETLESMASESRIGDTFGYCIVFEAGDKVANLGAGRFPIMDALSQAEIYYGKKFGKIACRLYYRRDIFSPRDLFCCGDDDVTLRLTFSQICGGVKTGEYYCKQAPDLSLLIAHQYCIQHGVENIEEKRIAKFCESCLPHDVYKTDKKNWCRMVRNTIIALRKKQGPDLNPNDIMAQVVRYTMQNLSQHFIRTYSVLTFNKVGGVCTYTSELSLSLSHEGVIVRQGNAITLTDDEVTDQVVKVPSILLEIPATSLKNVKLDINEDTCGTTLTISDIIGGHYEITSAHGPEIYAVLFRYIRDISTGADKESNA